MKDLGLIRRGVFAVSLGFVVSLAVGCGGSGASGGTPEAPGGGGETCEGYAPTDSCMNDQNFAECLTAAAHCPGEVRVMESCPLQFACPPDPSATTSSDADAPTSNETCEGYAPTDSCMNEDNFAECQSAAAECPGQVQVMESCPLQFACP